MRPQISAPFAYIKCSALYFHILFFMVQLFLEFRYIRYCYLSPIQRKENAL